MRIPASLPLVLSELERLGVSVEAVSWNGDEIAVDTETASYRRALTEMVESCDPAEWAQVVASLERGAQA